MNELAVQGSEVAWEQATGYAPGTRRKVLRRGASDEPLTVLLELPPGFEMNGHSHVHAEHHYVLEGAYESMGRLYGTGAYRMIPAHTDHGPFHSEAGALILVLWEC